MYVQVATRFWKNNSKCLQISNCPRRRVPQNSAVYNYGYVETPAVFTSQSQSSAEQP
jgi:hypothetical protein